MSTSDPLELVFAIKDEEVAPGVLEPILYASVGGQPWMRVVFKGGYVIQTYQAAAPTPYSTPEGMPVLPSIDAAKKVLQVLYQQAMVEYIENMRPDRNRIIRH